MQRRNFLGTELAPRRAGECRFHIIPVPYEATVSYGKGTAEGPAAILEASQQLEVWTGRSLPSEQGIYTWPAVQCSGTADEVLRNIEAAVAAALASGPKGALPQIVPAAKHASALCLAAPALPVILGGEHSVTLGALRALHKQYGHFGVIQFDAHADLRDSYEGTAYSHACVMRRATDELNLSLFQVGVRSLCLEEESIRNSTKTEHRDAHALFHLLQKTDCLHGKDRKTQLLPDTFPDKIYLSFDVDVFDCSLMPATGTPEPGGLFWWDALHLIERCLSGRICLGFDVVELAPIPGMHAPDYTAARLAHEIMGMIVQIDDAII